MTRREKLLSGLDLAHLNGAEIGPLNRPFVRKSDGPITYVDHAGTEALRAKYANDPAVDVNEIAPVDVIWGDKTLAEALGGVGSLDYVVASHVIEHVPDLIGWLDELAAVLKPGGAVRLFIPDKRFCFDYLRAETRLSDILAAHVVRARRPQLREVVDGMLYHRQIDARAAWNAEPTSEEITEEDLSRALFYAGLSADEYVDVHCWTFTPASFARLMEQLAALGMTAFGCAALTPTEPDELEFFVGLVSESDPAARLESWRAARRRVAIRGVSPAEERAHARCSALERELEDARRQIEALRTSTSWRITAPLRAVVNRVLRRQVH